MAWRSVDEMWSATCGDLYMLKRGRASHMGLPVFSHVCEVRDAALPAVATATATAVAATATATLGTRVGDVDADLTTVDLDAIQRLDRLVG
jgi:hypothetical protein